MVLNLRSDVIKTTHALPSAASWKAVKVLPLVGALILEVTRIVSGCQLTGNGRDENLRHDHTCWTMAGHSTVYPNWIGIVYSHGVLFVTLSSFTSRGMVRKHSPSCGGGRHGLPFHWT